MMKLYNALRGTVQVELTGGWVERFLNCCAREEIGFWKTEVQAPDRFTFWVSTADFFRLGKPARQTMTHVRILRKKGMPFGFHRLLKRKGLWISAILCGLGVWYLSGFLWTISITGCQTVSQREVLHLLEDAGLRFGTRSRMVDGDLLRNDVLGKTDELSYLVVNVHGTHAEIRVTERTPVPDLEAAKAPCDVVADGDGIIQRLRVLQGTAQVKVGDTVVRGDLLASGNMVDALGGLTQVHALAEADVRTWRTLGTAVSGSLFRTQRTGNVEKRQYLLVGSCKIPLDLIEKTTFACYDKTIKTQTLELREDFRFALALVTETYYECTVEQAEIDAGGLAEVLQEKMEAGYLAACPTAEIQGRTFYMAEENGRYVGTLSLDTIETIGAQAPLGEVIIQDGASD